MTDIVIAGALRTAIGKFGGSLAKIEPSAPANPLLKSSTASRQSKCPK